MQIVKSYLSMYASKLMVPFLVKCIEFVGESRVFHDFKVIGINEGYFEEFCDSINSALHLLKSERSEEYEIVTRNINCFAYNPQKSKNFAGYTQHYCIFNGDYWHDYSQLTRHKIMATAIVHEAFHGEYQRRFGVKAYGRNPVYEQLCREKEIELLLYFKESADEKAIVEFNHRLNTPHLIEAETRKTNDVL